MVTKITPFAQLKKKELETMNLSRLNGLKFFIAAHKVLLTTRRIFKLHALHTIILPSFTKLDYNATNI